MNSSWWHPALLVIALAGALPGLPRSRPGCLLFLTGLLLASLGLRPGEFPQSPGWLVLDALNLWLLPYTLLLHLAIVLCIPRSQLTPQSLHHLQISLAMDLCFFSLRQPLLLAIFWCLSHLGLVASLWGSPEKRLKKVLITFLGGGCLAFGLGTWGLAQGSDWAYWAFILAILLRKAMVPFHLWLPELFEKGPFGQAIAFSAPQLGAYASVRLLTGQANQELLGVLGGLALLTALHGACLAFGQNQFRRVYAGLFMGQTSLVLAGLQGQTPQSVVGGLTLWLSGGVALTGLGLCVWGLLARRGSMDLSQFHGGYERSPLLANAYLVFGLAACGFPATLGFLGQDLLLQGTTLEHPHIGVLTAVVTALNGITILRTYFRLFCGSPQSYAISQSLRPRERLAMLLLLAFLIGFGLMPRALLNSRYQAYQESHGPSRTISY